jgi:ABC-type glycerol-3-phosphate transport system substrate-binding protein
MGSEAFIRGDAAMSGFHWLGSSASFLDQNPDLDLAGVLTPLGPSSGGVRTISPGFSGLFVMATAAEPREGYLFLKWFFEEKGVDFVVRLAPGTVPASAASLEDPEVSKSPYLGYGRVLEDMKVAKLRNFHVFPGRLDVRSKEPGMAERVFLGEVSAREAVADFLKHADEVFRLYQQDLEEFREKHRIVW